MKTSKKEIVLFASLCFVIFVTLITGCTSSKPTSSTGGTNQTFTLKLGHVGPADPEHPWEKYALAFAQRVEKETNGMVKIKTYPASQLGADREMTEAIQQNTMEMGLISTIAMGNFVPEFQVWDLPYAFPADNAKVDQILEGPVADKIAAAASKKRIVPIGFWENDWRNISDNKLPITKVADMKGLKMRIVENKPSMDWFQRLGSIPTPMAFSELFTALQQKTVDGQDNGVVLTYGSRLYEATKYYTISKHIYCPLALVVSDKTWQQLPSDVQQTMKKIALEVGREQRRYSRQKASEWLETMKKAGVQVNELSPQALKEFQDSAQATYDKLADSIGKSLVDEMLQYRK